MKTNYDPNNFREFNAWGIGSGIGYKYVFKKGIFIDANLKVSKNLTNNLNFGDTYSFPDAKSFLGLSIGKRF